MNEQLLALLRSLGIVPDLTSPRPTAGQRVEAGARGAAEGATYGFVDELAGGLVAGLSEEQRRGLGRLMAPEGQEDRYADAAARVTYEDVQGTARRQQREGMAASPGDAIAGSVAGAMATSRAVPLPPATGIAERLGRAAGGGTLAGVGMSEADTVQGVAEDAAVSGGLGLGFGVAGEGVRGLVGSVDDAVAARRLARLRQAGIRTVPQRRAVAGRGGEEALQRAAADLEDAGVFDTPGVLPGSTDEVAERIAGMQERAGAGLGAAREAYRDMPVDVEPLRRWMRRQLIESPQFSGSKPIRKFWRDQIADLDRLAEDGPVTYGQLDDMRQWFGRLTAPGLRSNKENILLDAQRAVYGRLAEEQGRAARSFGAGSSYDTARRQYALGRTMEDATSADAVAGASAGLSRLEAGMAGVGAAAAGGPAGALTSIAGKRILQSERLPIAAALTREAAARGVQATGGAARSAATLGAGATARPSAPEPEPMTDITPDEEADAFYGAPAAEVTAEPIELSPDDEADEFYGD